MTMPRAPSALCSQMNVTVCAKLLSVIAGIAIRNWFRKVPDMTRKGYSGCEDAGSDASDTSDTGDTGKSVFWPVSLLCSQKLPLIRKSQLAVFLAQLRRKRVERRSQPQDRERGLVNLLATAGALDEHVAETAVAADRDFQDRIAGAAARILRE